VEEAPFPSYLPPAYKGYFGAFHVTRDRAAALFSEMRSLPLTPSLLLARGLFGRLLDVTQSVAVLTWHGRAWDATILLRVSLETLIRFRAAAIDPELADRMVYSDILEKERLVSPDAEAATGDWSAPERAKLNEIRGNLASLRDRFRRKGYREKGRIRISQLARVCGLEHLYESVYRFSSAYVHFSLRAIDEYIIKDDQGLPKQLEFAPTALRGDFHLLTSISFLLLGIETSVIGFDLRPPADLPDVLGKLAEIGVDPPPALVEFLNSHAGT